MTRAKDLDGTKGKAMSKKKIIFSILIFTIITVCAYVAKNTPVFEVIFYFVKPNFPTNKLKKIEYDKIKNNISIYFDDSGIPHISAKNIQDAVFASGFVQGRDRFFQMDFLRRVSQGRVSELVGNRPLFGSTTVALDLSMRGWGMNDISVKAIEKMDEETKSILLNFTDGVNLALKMYKPLEYKMLMTEPEVWKLEDSVSISLLQGWSITHNWEQELIRYLLALENGVNKSEKLYPSLPLQSKPSIKNNAKEKSQLPPAIAKEMIEFLNSLNPTDKKTSYLKNSDEGFLADLVQIRPSASNAWVVGKSKSESNAPILANDMHLTHTLPSLLYQQHIISGDLQVIGITLPGLPFIISGHNNFVAWAPTSSVADTVDLIVEKIDPKDFSKLITDKKECALTTTNVFINIRKNDNNIDKKIFQLRKSCHGPILNDMYPELFTQNAPLLAIQWETSGLEQSIKNLYKANLSKNIDELRDNLVNVSTPSQHIMAADVEGNIGFFLTGSIPKRDKILGTFPRPGWTSKYDWHGTYSKNELPYVKNPPEDYIVNANNLSVSPFEHKAYHQIDAAPSYRFERIYKLLSKDKKYTQKEIQDIQEDTYLLRAERLLPSILDDLKLISLKTNNEDESWYIEKLKNWNKESNPSQIEPLLFFELYRNMAQIALEPLLNKSGRKLFLKQRYSTNIIDEWILSSNHISWDNSKTQIVEQRSDITKLALEASILNLKDKHGSSWRNITWGQVHYSHPKHPFSGASKLLSILNLPRQPMAGALDSVWKAHFNLTDEEPFKVIAGPVSRTSINVGNWNKSLFVIDTGTSGWPLSPYYGNQYEMWKNGNMISMMFDLEKIILKYDQKKIMFVKK